MKKLGVSFFALMIGLPTLANAAVQSPVDVTVDSTKHVAATSFVQGAYNALAGVARDHATAIAGKQEQLTNGTNNVSATVSTSVRASGTADDATLVTEKAVRNAITDAGGQTAQQVEDAIDAAAGAGIATDGSGKLSVDLTLNGGLELTGTADAATVGVKVDGTHVIKDASGNVTLSETDINNLTAASTALQASDIDQIYNATSMNAQSGVAVASAISAAGSNYATAAQGTTADNTAALVGNEAMETTATTVTGAIKELHDKQVEVYTTWNTTATGKAAALVNPD